MTNSAPSLTRRNLLQVGGLGLFGLTLPQLLALDALGTGAKGAKSCIFLYLYGGPSQIDLWDMKPDAPEEFRGEFKPCATTVPGVQICELLPKMARQAKHYSILRTLHHNKRNHQPAGSYLLTGVDPQSDNAAQLKPRPDDPPGLGALAARLAPARGSCVPPFVMLPARVHDQGSPMRGQTGGWLGSGLDPLVLEQDPAAPNFRVDSFEQRESSERLQRRRSLLETLERDTSQRESEFQSMAEFQRRAFDLIASNKGRSAFNLQSEPTAVRERYGPNRFGQGCLVARRLVEAGARMVTVSDCTSSGHHEWDTHSGNFKKLKSTLAPRLDQAFSALLEDLLQRGLLNDTVVFVGGEFGRTPKVGFNAGTGAGKDGRDHYPCCFSALLCGGLTKPGLTYGVSDARAAYPDRDPVSMEDLTATLFAAMGLDPEGLVYTRDGRPVPLTYGKVVRALLR